MGQKYLHCHHLQFVFHNGKQRRELQNLYFDFIDANEDGRGVASAPGAQNWLHPAESNLATPLI